MGRGRGRDRKSREGVRKGERRQSDRMGGTGVDMGWNGKGRERENRKGTEMPEERDYTARKLQFLAPPLITRR